jgi:hypothetical protein
MATVAALPNTLRDKIAAVAGKMARLRLLRRVAVTVLVLGAMLGIILLADHWLRFGAPLRFLALGSWFAVAVAGIVTCFKALNRQADIDALAALIEREYPNLAERLTSSVELSEAADGGHGSPALINLLIRETEIRASKLDFLRAAPERSTYRLGTIAAGVILLILLPSAFWPRSYFGEVKRFLLPWTKTPLGYRIVAKPGDVAVARGHALTLSAFIEPAGEGDSLPDRASVVMTEASGKTVHLGMKSEQPLVFSCKFNSVEEGFRYHVEAGDAVGADHQVIAVDPVQLVGDSPSITVIPPAYARKAVETKTLTGLGDFAALEHSRLLFEFRFTQPAWAAFLSWTPQNSNNFEPGEDPKAVRHNLELNPDRLGARFEMSALQSGRFALTLEADHGIRTELQPQLLTVTVDRPPSFVKIAGTTEQMRTVNPYETIPLELSLADDFGVESAAIEYRVNDGETQTEAIKLDGSGTPMAGAKHALKLAGKVKEGDTFQFRMRVADNRRVPEAKLEPHVIYHPAENRWLSFKVERNAEPLKQQEILAQRDDVRKRLEALIADLKRERKDITILQSLAKQAEKFLPEPAFRLQEVRKDHQGNDKTLSELARDVALTPALSALANRLLEVGDQEMRNATSALQKADKEKNAAKPRDREIQDAYSAVDQVHRAAGKPAKGE